MILNLPGRPKLTYCLNVHPGEAWKEQKAAMEKHVPVLRQRLGCPGKFGVGLRLSARGVLDLEDLQERYAAACFFQEKNLDPFTFNGFPYGPFHGARVKESVYQPDWKTRERVDYTKGLAGLMALFIGEGKGSISTVPGTFCVPAVTPADEILMARHLAECAVFLDGLSGKSGCEIVLGLEPEPACHIENTEQLIRFFEDVVLVHGKKFLEKGHGLSPEKGEEILRKHLGICLDTCHAAIQFERVEDSIRKILAAGIPIAKIQISNALEIRNSAEARKALEAFDEPVYLHQVRAQGEDGFLRSWTDLREGLAGLAEMPEGVRARIHFHVPLFWEGAGILGSTRNTLTPEFWRLCREGAAPHLEMETYTFSVLPEAAGKYDLAEMLEREYRWVLDQLSARPETA